MSLSDQVALGYSQYSPFATPTDAKVPSALKTSASAKSAFKADGTFASVGVANGKYWDYPDATWSLKGNKLALSSGDYKSNVRLEIIPGYSLALVDEKGNRNVFDYCENDLADEVVGMWVSNDTPNAQKNDVAIITFFESKYLLRKFH